MAITPTVLYKEYIMNILTFIIDNWASLATVVTLIVTAVAPATSVVAKALPKALEILYKGAKLLQEYELKKKKKD